MAGNSYSTKSKGQLRLSASRRRRNSHKILRARAVLKGLLTNQSGNGTETVAPNTPEQSTTLPDTCDRRHLTLSTQRKKPRINDGLLAYKLQILQPRNNCTMPTQPSAPSVYHFTESDNLSEQLQIEEILREEKAINCHELAVEHVPMDASEDAEIGKIEGRYIVDGQHFVRAMRKLENHRDRCLKSSKAQFKLNSSTVKAFMLKMTFECPHCKIQEVVTSEPVAEQPMVGKLSVADGVVWGTMAMGGGHANLDELFSHIGVKPLNKKTFARKEAQLGEVWERQLFEAMREAGNVELELAVANGDVDGNGIPFITVIVDGGWSHRSHGHRFSAKSGVACVIGLRTGKLLHMDVRNKFCSMCQYRQKNGLEVQHEGCFRNWSGTSSAMEQDMLVEAFRSSKAIHGLEYTVVIGDGDSSVFRNLREKIPYGLKIQKSECANHAVKNYTKALYNQKLLPQAAKRIVSARTIQRLKKDARSAIYHVAQTTKSPQDLRDDLENGPAHVLGVHEQCKEYFCDKGQENEATLEGARLIAFNFMRECLKPLVRKAHRLVHNDTSNMAENFMSLVAKFAGGKQVNRSNRGSYSYRARGAGLDFQHGVTWSCCAVRKLTGKSPSVTLKMHAARRGRARIHTAASRLKYSKVRRSIIPLAATDNGRKDYGSNCQEEDMPAKDFAREKEVLLTKLAEDEDGRKALEEKTRGQHENEEWHSARKYRLTASNFGKICKRKNMETFGKVVEQLLYAKPFTAPAIQYGQFHESEALEEYKARFPKRQVRTCGLFVHEDYGYLGASPDGLIGNKGILEIKCPKRAEKMNFKEACKTVPRFFLDRKGKLKRNHDYYYQIQGQLGITGRAFCDFVVWGPKFLHVERIRRDDKFWGEQLVKLATFFHSHLIFEIIDPRKCRSMHIR